MTSWLICLIEVFANWPNHNPPPPAGSCPHRSKTYIVLEASDLSSPLKSQFCVKIFYEKSHLSRAESSRPLLGPLEIHPIISSCLCIKTPFARSQWFVFDITPLRAVLGLFERSSTRRDLPSRILSKIRPNGFLEKRRPRICSPLKFRVRLLH